MNEELLKRIYDDYLTGKGSYDDLKKDIQNPRVRQTIYKDYLSDKGTYDDFEKDLGFSQPTQQDPQKPAQTSAQENLTPEPESDFHKKLGKIPIIGGMLQKGLDAFNSGIDQGTSLSEGINALTKGKNLNDQELEGMAQILQQNARQIRSNQSFTSKFMSDGGWNMSPGEFGGLLAETIIQSGASMVAGFFDAFTNKRSAELLAAGTGAGALTGSSVPGVGTAIGASAGAWGSVSGLSEAAGMVWDETEQELQKRGLSRTPENIKSVFSDDSFMSKLRERAVVKGLVVGTVDALTIGLEGKLGGKAAETIAKENLVGAAAKKEVIKDVAKGLAVNVVGGSGGEALSEKAIGDPLDLKSIFLEGFAEIPGTAGGFIGGFTGKSQMIKDAKKLRTEADKTGSPITSDIKNASEESLSIGHVVKAHENNDFDTMITALSDLSVRHSKEEFDAMLQTMGNTEGLSPEEMQSISARFDEVKKVADTFNTPDLITDPQARSRAVKARLDANELEAAKKTVQDQMQAADESLKPQYQSQIDDLDSKIEDQNSTVSSIVERKITPVIDAKLRLGSTIDYQGIKGKVVEEDGIVYVETDKGEKVLIEGGANPDVTLKDLGATELVAPGKKKSANTNDIKTDFSTNTVLVNDQEHDFVRTNTSKNGEDVSVTLSDRKTGKEKTFRNPADVSAILIEKIKHESRQSGQSTADIVGGLENHAEQSGISQQRPNKRVGRGVSESVQREKSLAALRELSKQKFDQIDNSKKTLDQVESEMADYGRLIEDEVNTNPAHIGKTGGFFSVFDKEPLHLPEEKGAVTDKGDAGILGRALHNRVPSAVLKSIGGGDISKGQEIISHLRKLNERRHSLLKENAINKVKANKLEASQLEGQALAAERNAKEAELRTRIKDLEDQKAAAIAAVPEKTSKERKAKPQKVKEIEKTYAPQIAEVQKQVDEIVKTTLPVDKNDSAKTQSFFSDVVNGLSDKYKPIKAWSPIGTFTKAQTLFKQVYDKFKGKFDEHIATSIPTFRETQIKVGNALVSMFGKKGGLIYDIGGSEGGFIKAITQQSEGKIKSINLEPNPDMKAAYNVNPVSGSKIVQEAFYAPFTENGVTYKAHVPTEKADVVHESMVFQFITPEREAFVQEVTDKYLKSDGLFLTEEKLSTDPETYLANEKKKNEYKDQYYTKEQQATKADDVLVGMKKNQADVNAYEKLLKDKFKFVSKYWDSGNFKGFVASNSEAQVNEFLKQVGDTSSEFSTTNEGANEGANLAEKNAVPTTEETPAVVKPETPKQTKEEIKATEAHEKKMDEHLDLIEKANNENTNYIRTEVLNLDPVTAKAMGVDDIIEEAKANYISKDNGIGGAFSIENSLVVDVLSGRMLLNAPQVVSLANALHKMQLEHAKTLDLIKRAEEQGLERDIPGYEQILDNLEDLMDTYTTALNRTGTDTARALMVRSKVLFKNRWTTTNLRTSLETRLKRQGGQLSDQHKAFIDETVAKLEKLNKQLDDALKQDDKSVEKTRELVAQQEISKIAKEGVFKKLVRGGKSLTEALSAWDKINSGKNC